MRIDIQQLKVGPVDYEIDFSPDFLNSETQDDQRFDAARGNVTFRMLRNEVEATGRLATTVHGTCARCLCEVAKPLSVEVRLYFWPRENEPSKEPDALEYDPDAPDCALFEGGIIVPDADLRETLLVEAPAILLCDEACKGLCPRCGQNLNDAPCACFPDEDLPAPTVSNVAWKSQLKSIKLA